MRTVRLGGILGLSTVDWPGRPCTVVFFAGCNFRCPFCQNSTLIPLDSGEVVDVGAVKERLRAGSVIVDAVHITGGEPTLQPLGLETLCRAAKEVGMDVGINTNGSNPHVLETLLKANLVDHVAIDVKAPLDLVSYAKATGVDGDWALKQVERTLKLLGSSKVKLEVRTTVVPGLIDEEEVVSIISQLPRYDYYVLSQFIPSEAVLDPSLRNTPATPRVKLVEIARKAIRRGAVNVYIRTREAGLEKISGVE
ncbi:MAG: anaerobic ribonucleoside-triphosphate reductase activating protein [Candidatus Nezhaarchaeota archaeon]|nr:anaerobic ribonucleoside-triphosphate reductase activating protein [Candidatus Nezhaarchaeota archaeon]